MQGGVSGFQNAPVTRAFALACALLTAVFGIKSRSRQLGLSYPDIIQNFRFWRLFASVFAFSSTPELIFGLYLLYYFRIFERQIGSNKYSVFVLFSITLTSALEFLGLLLFKDGIFSTFASGPYGLLFALFVPFYLDIPVTSRFRIFGLQLSDKSFIYIAGLQLLLSAWRKSLLPGIFGLLAGLAYRANFLGIRNKKFPNAVASYFATIFAPNVSNPSRPTRGIIRNIPAIVGRQAQQNFPRVASAPAPEPSESSIATLVQMGFDSNAARQALVHARNDINVATNILLEASSQ